MSEIQFNNGLNMALLNRFYSFKPFEKSIFMICTSSIIHDAAKSKKPINSNDDYILSLEESNLKLLNSLLNTDMYKPFEHITFELLLQNVRKVFMEQLSYHLIEDNNEISNLHVKLFPSISWSIDSKSIIYVNIGIQFKDWLNEVLNEADYSYPRVIQLINDKISEIRNI